MIKQQQPGRGELMSVSEYKSSVREDKRQGWKTDPKPGVPWIWTKMYHRCMFFSWILNVMGFSKVRLITSGLYLINDDSRSMQNSVTLSDGNGKWGSLDWVKFRRVWPYLVNCSESRNPLCRSPNTSFCKTPTGWHINKSHTLLQTYWLKDA